MRSAISSSCYAFALQLRPHDVAAVLNDAGSAIYELADALTVARNRLQYLKLELPANTQIAWDCADWIEEATAALAKVRGGA